VAWLALDSADNDPTRFWRYLLTALDQLVPGAAGAALALLEAPRPPPIEALLTPLLNALSARQATAAGGRGVLVVDDLHVIDAPDIYRALAMLIDYLPPQLHLVLLMRAEPPLPLARWRASGHMTELRAADLRFTPDEVIAYLTGCMSLPLSPAEGAALAARTEGWIAGLRLATLAMRGRGDLGEFVRTFTGSTRYVADYLVEEVVARLSPQLQSFLLHTSILDRLCGPLCDAILGDRGWGLGIGPFFPSPIPHPPSPTPQAYSQLILEKLERANIFTVALDDVRYWYRYHHLFAEALRERLRSQATPETVAALHRRASTWFEAHGLIAEAIGHGLAALDFERVAGLLEQNAEALLMRGEYITLQGWLDAVPAALVRASPRLSLAYAEICLLSHGLEAAEQYLNQAEQAIRSGNSGKNLASEVAALHASVALYQNDWPGTIKAALHALEDLPLDHTRLRGRTMLQLGLAQFWGGALPEARQTLAQASRLGSAAGDLLTALAARCNEAAVQFVQGQLRLAAGTYQQALDLAAERGASQLPIAGMAHSYLAEVLYEWDDLEAAARHVGEAIELGERGHAPRFLMLSQLTLALLEQARGDQAAARNAVVKAAQLAQAYSLPLAYVGRLAEVQARLWLMQGDLASAGQWARTSGLSVDDDLDYLHERQYMALARILIARGEAGSTIGILSRLLQSAEAGERAKHVVEILSLQALAFQASGASAQALLALEQALALAQPQGYIRTLVDAGAPMIALLGAAQAQRISPGYVDMLLAAFSRTEDRGLRTEAQLSVLSPQSSALAAVLTARELEVLGLLAAGTSTNAIARQLTLSPGTVKKHVSNILGKFHVHNRIQAVARARELRLL
jgi:LuxR family maltose regulon positive regulatory protein